MSPEDKPFECVGERRESAAAFRLLAERPEWRDAAVVTALADRARALVSDQDVASLLTPATDLAFPDPEVAAAVDRFFASPMILDDLRGRRVAVWGLGQEGMATDAPVGLAGRGPDPDRRPPRGRRRPGSAGPAAGRPPGQVDWSASTSWSGPRG